MTHRSRPPHEESAFLRKEFRGVVITASDDPKCFEWMYFGDRPGGFRKSSYGSKINGMGCLSPLTDARVFRMDDECGRLDTERRDRKFLRAQLLGEARDCWRAFFASTVRPELPIEWHFADKAREFEASAARVAL
jgi:hypothetical protein